MHSIAANDRKLTQETSKEGVRRKYAAHDGEILYEPVQDGGVSRDACPRPRSPQDTPRRAFSAIARGPAAVTRLR